MNNSHSDECSEASAAPESREARAGKAARDASFGFCRHFGSFYDPQREKPHYIREYGREPTEIIFETDDSFECSNELQRIEDEFVGKAALQAATNTSEESCDE